MVCSIRHFHFGLRLAGFSLALVLVCTSFSAWVVHESKVESLAGQSADYLLSLARAGSLLVEAGTWGGKELAEVQLDRDLPAEPEGDESVGVLLPSSSFGGVKPSFFLLRCVSGVGKSLELEMVRASVDEAGRHFYPGKQLSLADHHAKALLGRPSSTGLYADFDGRWISAVVPVRDAGGRIAGLLQADLPGAWIRDTAMNAAAGVIKVGFWCVLGGLGLALLWGWRFEQRVRAMGLALTQIAASDFRRQILTEQPDELAGMSDSLNRMLELLKLSRDGLLFQSSRWKDAFEKADKINRARSEFLATLSHEMRGTVGGVLGIHQILLGTPMTPEQRDLVQTIHHSSESLMALLNDILDFSKIETGKLNFVHIDFDLRRLVESTVDLYAETAERKGVELLAGIDEDVPSAVRGDPGRLRQVLANLLGNAVKFTHQGEVRLTVTTAAVSPGEVALYVTVADTGVGIPEEALLGMFQGFRELETAWVRKFEGTGLGLAICKNLVEAMQGNIGVESRVGNGSNFWFTVKLSLPEAAPDIQVPQEDEFYGMRALIVDDHATFRAWTGRMLSAWGVRHDEAADAVDALRFLHRDANLNIPYRIVLVDARLEGMNGFTLARTILQDEQLAGTKVALLTAGKDRIETETLEAAGIWRCLRKPLKRQDLLECLRAAQSNLVEPEAKPGPPASFPSMDEPPASPQTTCRGLRLLVAENEEVSQKLIGVLAHQLGCETVVVDDGRSALEAWRNKPFDILLLDCFMPGLDGFEVARGIRAEEARTRRSDPASPAVYMIAMTANTMAGDRETCLDAGMDDYLAQPITLAALQAALLRGANHRSRFSKAA